MLDLPNPAFLADPHPTWERLRAEEPVARIRVDGEEVLALARYDDCVKVLRDPRLALSWRKEEPPLRDGAAARMLRWMLAVQDPREPNAARSRVARCFTPRAVDARRSRVREGVDEILDRAEDKGVFDLAEDFAFPVAMRTAAGLLGVPPEDDGLLRSLAGKALCPFERAGRTPAEIEACHGAIDSLWTYFEEHVRRRRPRSGDDLLAQLIGACDAEGVCGDRELVAFCVNLLVLGLHRSEALIAGGALALVRHPDAMRQLRRDSSLVVAGVEECARWDSPVQMSRRVAAADVLLAGFPVREGEAIYLLIGSANRDGEVFAAPDVFDVTRESPPHLSFGLGDRPLLDRHLMRMQAQIALRQLVRRFPGLEPVGETVYRPSLATRSIAHCPVAQAD